MKRKRRQPTKQSRVDDTCAQKAPRQNLTLSNWLMVYAYVDIHPDATQADIVRHFSSLPNGALTFDQSTLSRRLRQRPQMEACANDNPDALSSKRPLVRPGIEAQDRVFGSSPVSDELLEPPEEKEIEKEAQIRSVGGDGAVHLEMGGAGNDVEIDSDSEENPVVTPITRITREEAISICKQLERAVMDFGDAADIIALSPLLRHFRTKLRCEQSLHTLERLLNS